MKVCQLDSPLFPRTFAKKRCQEGGRRGENNVSYWVARGTIASEDPSKYRLEGDWSSRRPNLPALQKDLGENVDSEEDFNPYLSDTLNNDASNIALPSSWPRGDRKAGNGL